MQSGAVKHTPSATLQARYLRLHQFVYRQTRGIVGRHAGGHRALLLTTRGRRSGRDHTVALIYARNGKDLVVVASNGGSDRHPAWYWNITADPKVDVQTGRKRFPAVARVPSGQECAALWSLVNRKNRGLAPLMHPGAKGRYDAYQRHTDRQIPMVVLTPGG